ncbi:unnamed protein product [Paramecium octaurelia]|uniref:Transmembrane protein n=1 Tax=Paramecium octaurelia TaxID=43137 RepID=A0A8S1SH17_PAROT|nr:unnamed protein product [Paramecium octaurelia]
MKLVSCKYSGDLINIQLLVVDSSFSQLFQLNLDYQKNQIQFQLLNEFRNFIPQNSFVITDFIIQYIDDTILVLKQTGYVFSQFYEFHQDRKLYDYFHKSEISMQIKRLNIYLFQMKMKSFYMNNTPILQFFYNTHFIFTDSLSIYIGIIGYELEVQNCDEIEQNFELLAYNEISNERVSLQLHLIKTNQYSMNSILGIQISCLAFIFIYTSKIKSKSRNQKQNR